MRTAGKFTALAAIAALSLAACGSAPESDDSGSSSKAPTSSVSAVAGFKPCIVSDLGGFDDKSFNQLSFEGANQAAQELGTDLVQIQSNAASDYKQNLQSLVDQNCGVIVSVGFNLSAPTVESARANPDGHYVLIDDAADNNTGDTTDGKPDGKKDAENIKPLLYDTAQAAFLAGYLAAGYSKAGKVGTYGGLEIPTVTIFMDGFKQGVDYYNKAKGKNVQIFGWGGNSNAFTGGFDANEKAKTTAKNVIDQGIDVLLPVGGPIYQSGLAAIQDSGRDIALIGVDADLFLTDPKTADYVLTSIQKKMDVSTKEAVLAAGQGEFDATAYIGTLKNGGVDIAPLHNFESKVDSALVQEVNDLKAKVISGEVPVTSYLAGQ